MTLDLDGVEEVLQLACRNVSRFLHNYGRLMDECCSSPFSVTLEASEADVVTRMAFCVVNPVDRELLCVLWLIAPEDLDTAGSTSVALCFQGFNVFHAQVVCQALDVAKDEVIKMQNLSF